MSRIRVLDLAKELGLETKATILKLQEIGIQVKNHFNALSDIEADKLRSYLKSNKKPQEFSTQAKAANRVVIRRRVEQAPVQVEQYNETDKIVENEFEQNEPQNIDYNNSFDSFENQAANNEETHSEVENATEISSKDEAGVPNNFTINKEIEDAQKPQQLESHAPIHKAESVIHTPVNMPEVLAPKPQIKATTQTVTPAEQSPIVLQKNTTSTAKQPYSAVIVRKAEPPKPVPVQPQQPERKGTDQRYGNNQQGYNKFGDKNSSGQFGNRQGQQGDYNRNNTQRNDNNTPQNGGYRNNSNQNTNNTSNSDGRGEFVRSYNRNQDTSQSGQNGGFQPRPLNNNRPLSSGQPQRPFTPPPALPDGIALQKEARVRVESHKDKDKRSRMIDEEESKRTSGLKAKSRLDEDLLIEIESEILDTDADPEKVDNSVRTVIPNRKKISSIYGGKRKKEHKKAEIANPMKASKRIVRVDESISVGDLASELSIKASAVVKFLMKLGMLATANQVIDFDTATLVAQEFGFETQNTTVNISDILAKKSSDTAKEEQIPRPPIVTIMGHVDHGKTSLLDAIRSTNVVSKEAGGITQHIGAYQVERNGRKITFLDTPGHEAFTSMRARGAQLTDVVVLVVAADDGVMPQTIEAIAHAKAANVPLVVAINKIDKPGINYDRILRELSQHGINSDEWGGDNIFVKVSAKTKEGIPELLESILLQADLLELIARVKGQALGVVIEGRLDRNRGTIASLIVTQGILNLSDWIVAGTSYGRIKAMFDDKGNAITSAGPATPVEILGLADVPSSGDQFNVVANDAIAKEAVAFRITKTKEKELSQIEKRSTPEELLTRMSDEATPRSKELTLIIKADTHGSVEAIRHSLPKLDTEKVKTKIIHYAVGGITETDVVLAKASNALILGFNIRPDRLAEQEAERNNVAIKCFTIIYELIDAVQNSMVGCLSPVKTEKFLGRAEVRSLFSVPKIGVIAGTAITDGKVQRNANVRIVRSGTVIYTGRIGSLRRFKEDAKEVLQGFECGIGVENYNDLKLGDILEAFIIEDVAPTLN